MTQTDFENILGRAALTLREEALRSPYTTSKQFENRVREVLQDILGSSTAIDFDPHPQAFPDIAVGSFGVEVKFTTNDTWRSVANSVLETNRIQTVSKVYVMFGKMGGEPDVKWADYESSVIHVRTSHVPRLEVEVFPAPAKSLFEMMGISYDEFRRSPMEDKMRHIRAYARGRLKQGERLWWLEDSPGEEHPLPIQARLYTKLSSTEKIRLRAEAVLLCPQVVDSGRSRTKYDDVVLYLLTYHGVLCHQARDLFSAGSVANPGNEESGKGGVYIAQALKLIENDILAAAQRMDGALFEEYWGVAVPPERRIREWLRKADAIARDWHPSAFLFSGKYSRPG